MNTEIYSYTKERIEELTRSTELYGSVTLSKDQMILESKKLNFVIRCLSFKRTPAEIYHQEKLWNNIYDTDDFVCINVYELED